MDELQKKVLQHINGEALVDLLIDLLRIPSDSGQEQEIAEFLVTRMKDMGIEAHLQEVEPGCGPNAIGILRGDQDYRSLMFNGHTDQMRRGPGRWPPVDPSVYLPEVKDGRVYGYEHMKSGLAAMLMAAYAIKQANIKPRGDIILTFVSCECDPSSAGAVAAVKQYSADACLNTEPTGTHRVCLVHAGCAQFKVTVKGTPSVHYRTTFPFHPPEKRPELNAIRKMARVISAIDESILTYQEHERFGGLPSVVIGKIEGGIGPQWTAPSCTIQLDVRMVPGMTVESVKKDLERAINKLMRENTELEAMVDLKTRVDLLEGEGPRFYPSSPYMCSWDEPIVQSIRKAHKDFTGEELEVAGIFDTMLGSSRTDAPVMIEAGIPTTIYGPFTEDRSGDGSDKTAVSMHSTSTRIDDLTDTCKVMALAALDFVTRKKEAMAKLPEEPIKDTTRTLMASS